MVRFYCDRCGMEVEGPDDLIEVVAEGRERPNLAAWSCRSEVCRGCYDALKEAVGALFGTAEEGKRKALRRTGS
jgi:hypothetical protein